MLASDSLSSIALSELASIIIEAPIVIDIGDIFTRRVEYVHYIALLHVWDSSFDLREIIILFDALYNDLVELRTALISLLVKLDADAGVSDSNYQASIPVRNQSFLR